MTELETAPVNSSPMPPRHEQGESIIRSHTLWAMGAGLMPVPLLDVAAVTAVQMDLVRSLAKLHGIDVTVASGKAFVSALAGGTLARLGASLVKSVPGVGTVVGGASMSILSAASTFAIGHVLLKHFETGGTFDTIDLTWAKDAYGSAYDRGRTWVETHLKPKADPHTAQAVFEALEKLRALRESNVLSEEEFNQLKEKLLAKV
jgi:uncharacterized protein (DUF697 family)